MELPSHSEKELLQKNQWLDKYTLLQYSLTSQELYRYGHGVTGRGVLSRNGVGMYVELSLRSFCSGANKLLLHLSECSGKKSGQMLNY